MTNAPIDSGRGCPAQSDRYDLPRQESSWGHSFLPDFPALLDRLDRIFQQYGRRRAETLRKHINTGSAGLTDCDILRSILDPVLDGRNTKVIAESLLRKFRTFGAVVHAPASQLMAVGGIGEAGAAALKTVEGAVAHLLRESISNKPILDTPEGVRDFLLATLQHKRVEVIFALYLDCHHHLIQGEELSHGTVSEVALYPRELMRRCLELNATAIIIAHNHPSGNLEVTYQDREVTEDISHAAKVLGITVIDHIIVGRGEVLSMREHDLF